MRVTLCVEKEKFDHDTFLSTHKRISCAPNHINRNTQITTEQTIRIGSVIKTTEMFDAKAFI